jgi:hypothetical protein
MSARKKNYCLLFSGLLIASGIFFYLAAGPGVVMCQDTNKEIRADKKLCALMIRAGQEAFERRKYSAARSYLKKAIQADADSEEAWHWYNVVLSYALAEQSQNILYPDLAPPSTAAPAPGMARPALKTLPLRKTPKKSGFKLKMGAGAEDC